MTVKNLLFKNSRPLKYFIFSLSCVVFAVILTSCEQNPTAPNEPPKPYGYQEDIYWPSLADSPWPRYHGNAQNNGRTILIGPLNGSLFKSLTVERVNSGLVIGSNSSIYFATSYPGNLYSFTKDGDQNWSIKLTDQEIESTPVVGNDGTIYVGLFQEKKLLAISEAGEIKWSISMGGIVQIGISIGLDGTLYFIDTESNLNAVNKYGELLWKLFDDSFGSVGTGNSAMSPDGKVLYICSSDKLYAIDITSKTIQWTFGETIGSTILVDSKGNLYCVAKDTSQNADPIYYFSLTSNGMVRWKFRVDGWVSYSNQDATMDKNGNVFFASDTVYSLDYYGNLRWKQNFPGEYFASSFICDGSGNLYSVSSSMLSYQKTIYCFNTNGEVGWTLPYYTEGLIYGSATIGFDNTIYIPVDSNPSEILIIK